MTNFDRLSAVSIKDSISDALLGKILSGELKPGDRLPAERDMAEQMGVSRSSLHHAVLQLETQGFLRIEPRRGTVVADFAETGNLETLNAILRYNGGKLDRQMVVSIVELRSAIEGGSLIRLGRQHSEKDMEELRSMMAEFEAASLLSPTTSEVAAALARFHYKICTLSGNQLFPLIMNAFRGVGSILWESSARFWGEKALYEQGMHIIELIDEGRGEDAANYLNALFEHYLENVSL